MRRQRLCSALGAGAGLAQLRQDLARQRELIRLHPSTIPRHRFISMEHWRACSGKDAHSIFADPLHLACAEQRFELDPQSLNSGAGERKSTIGCMGPVAR